MTGSAVLPGFGLRKRNVTGQADGRVYFRCKHRYKRRATSRRADGISIQTARIFLGEGCRSENGHICPSPRYVEGRTTQPSTPPADTRRMLDYYRAVLVARILELGHGWAYGGRVLRECRWPVDFGFRFRSLARLESHAPTDR